MDTPKTKKEWAAQILDRAYDAVHWGDGFASAQLASEGDVEKIEAIGRNKGLEEAAKLWEETLPHVAEIIRSLQTK